MPTSAHALERDALRLREEDVHVARPVARPEGALPAPAAIRDDVEARPGGNLAADDLLLEQGQVVERRRDRGV